MLRLIKSCVLPLLFASLACLTAHAKERRWSDASGRFTVNADLVAINEEVIVLKATKDGRLIAVEIAQLSQDDQAFIKSEEGGTKSLGDKDKEQVWHLAGDIEIVGQVVGYYAQDHLVERHSARLVVDGTKEADLPELTLRLMPMIVENFETAKIKDLPSLKSWLAAEGPVPHTYHVEGVKIALADGEEVKIPIFLFVSQERALLEPGLTRWRAVQAEKLEEAERSRYAQREALMLSSAARAYQQDARADARTRALNAQARMMQLELLSVEAGVTDLWEVLLIPANRYAYPFTVVVPARDSGAAQLIAANRYPGYGIDATRKFAGY